MVCLIAFLLDGKARMAYLMTYVVTALIGGWPAIVMHIVMGGVWFALFRLFAHFHD